MVAEEKKESEEVLHCMDGTLYSNHNKNELYGNYNKKKRKMIVFSEYGQEQKLVKMEKLTRLLNFDF